VYERIGYHHHSTFDEWLFSLQWDLYLTRSLRVWEAMAQCADEYQAAHPDSDAEDVAFELYPISMNARFEEEDRQCLELQEIFIRTWRAMEE
jgi:hypothetical protein